MSCYTSLGVTVAPEEGMHFLRFLKKLDDQPDTVSQGNDGSVSAVWEDRNHFDRYSDDENYDAIMAFLEDLDDDKYIYESVTEDCAPEIGGRLLLRIRQGGPLRCLRRTRGPRFGRVGEQEEEGPAGPSQEALTWSC